MKIVLVHGIHQDGKDPVELRREWIRVLEQSLLSHTGFRLPQTTSILLPFYGDILAQHVQDLRGVRGGTSDPLDAFIESGAAEFIDAQGSRPSDGQSNERGKLPHKRSIKFSARLIERLSPFQGALALRFLKQAYAYIRLKPARSAVDEIVRPHLQGDERTIVISHSLGTVVAYRAIQELSHEGHLAPIPLFITMGSPLSLRLLKRHLGVQRKPVSEVARWVNVADVEDFIALGNELKGEDFAAKIENHLLSGRGLEDPHGLTEYLGSSPVASAVHRALQEFTD